MNTKKKEGQKGKSITEQICDIDNKILQLLAKRSDLLKKSAQARSQKNLSLVDSEQEKKIWKQWYYTLENLGLNEKSLKKIFHFSNALGYQKAEEKKEQNFPLKPTRKEVNINIPGPRDRDISRFWMSVAAMGGTPIKIDSAVLNDSNVELAKALNMAEGNFSWEKSGISKDVPGYLDFDHKLIFAGSDSLNLYILICLAALQPGYCKFTGSSALKVKNLNHLYEVLPKLGARAVPLVPGNEGLPLRIESSGEWEEEIQIPEAVPEGLIAVISLCLPFVYPSKEMITFKLNWGSEIDYPARLERVARVLNSCGMEANLSASEFQVEPKKNPSCPGLPNVALDPVLSAYVLVMVKIQGGVVELQGDFPAWSSDGKLVERILSDLGICLSKHAHKVVATGGGEIGNKVQLGISNSSELYPLCLAVGAVLPCSVSLQMPEDEVDDFGVFLLEKIGVSYRREGGLLEITGTPGEPHEEVSIFVPDAWWGLAVALLAMKRPNMLLENPGELTRLWPYFWNLYKGLPDPQAAKNKNTLERAQSETRKRRRKVE